MTLNQDGVVVEQSAIDINNNEVALAKEENSYHKLENTWSFYLFQLNENKDWLEQMKKIADVSSVEEFWTLMNFLVKPTNLPAGCDFYVFKQHIQPNWEDACNKNGGSWSMAFLKSKPDNQLDSSWLEILMLLIGETLEEDSDQICGATINVRGKYVRLSVWTSDATNDESVLRIGRAIIEALNTKEKLQYKTHNDNQVQSTSRAKFIHILN